MTGLRSSSVISGIRAASLTSLSLFTDTAVVFH
jgi:hypothetical protein